MWQLTIALCALGGTLLAQQLPTIRARVDLVTIDTLVTEGERPVGGLTLGDFEVRDNGVLQRLASADRDTVPLDLYVALDTSHSVRGPVFTHLVAAARAAVGQLRPEDRVSVIAFSDRLVRLSALTHDHRSVQQSLDGAVPYGPTRLFDAMMTTMLTAGTAGRKSLLLVYTDEVDTMSWTRPADLQEAASRSDAVVYLVAPRRDLPRSRRRSAVKTGEYSLPVQHPPTSIILHEKPPLEVLVLQTGGRVVRIGDTHQLARLFREMVGEFRTRYLLSYYPEGVALEGWHTIEVRLRHRGSNVQARRGYYVQPESQPFK